LSEHDVWWITINVSAKVDALVIAARSRAPSLQLIAMVIEGNTLTTQTAQQLCLITTRLIMLL